jgi:hypothetical protein
VPFSVVGLRSPAGALEAERLRDDADRQGADLLRDAGDHGRASGAGSAA